MSEKTTRQPGLVRSKNWALNNEPIKHLLDMDLYSLKLVDNNKFYKKTVLSVIGFGAMGDNKYRFLTIDDDKYLIVRVR